MPLYLTAWDIQPGIGSKTQGSEAFRLFAQQLRRYAPLPPGLTEAAWLRDIDRTRCQAGVGADDPAALRAIDELRQWNLAGAASHAEGLSCTAACHGAHTHSRQPPAKHDAVSAAWQDLL
jgi:hypothetical protein